MSFPESDRVDLHTHSRASDGTHAPAELVRLAHKSSLTGLALTDHDTLAGVAEAAAEAAACGIDFLPGIEVSCLFPRPGTMHILGYGLDPAAAAARELVDVLTAARDERVALTVERLNRAGVDLSVAEVLDAAGPGAGSIGRPHVAKLLVRKGYAISTRDAFDRFIGGGGVAYVQNHPLTAPEAIALIRAAGGMASLAHPLQLRRRTWAQTASLIEELAEQGMEGVETIHSSHREEDVHRLTRLADRLELITTGGSDFHGAAKPWIRLGEAAGGRLVPRPLFDAVRARVKDRQPAPAPTETKSAA